MYRYVQEDLYFREHHRDGGVHDGKVYFKRNEKDLRFQIDFKRNGAMFF